MHEIASRLSLALVLGVLLVGASLVPPRSAVAQEELTHFEFMGGVYFPAVDTKGRLDGTGGLLGTSLDFESDLGLDDSKTLGVFNASYRVNSRHRVDFAYMSLKRDAVAASRITIRFGDQVFEAQADLESVFDSTVYYFGYQFSLINDQRGELAVRGGLNFMDLETGLAIPGQEISARGEVSAPFPAFGAYGRLPLVGGLSLDGDFGWFGADFDTLDGSLWVVRAGARYQFNRNFGLGAAYYLNHVDFTVDAEDYNGSIDYTFQGPLIFASVGF